MGIKLDLTLTHLPLHSDFSQYLHTYHSQKSTVIRAEILLVWENFIDQISDFDMKQNRTFFRPSSYFKNLYLNYENKIVLQIHVTLRQGGMFDILKIHFSITFWVHIQLYMDMVLLFRCISNNEGFRKIIICV